MFSLRLVGQHVISIHSVTDDAHLGHLFKVVPARLLHGEVAFFFFVIIKYVVLLWGRTSKPCKYPIPHQIFHLFGYIYFFKFYLFT